MFQHIYYILLIHKARNFAASHGFVFFPPVRFWFDLTFYLTFYLFKINVLKLLCAFSEMNAVKFNLLIVNLKSTL